MNSRQTRRTFLATSVKAGLALGWGLESLPRCLTEISSSPDIPLIKTGEPQLFVDDVRIARTAGVRRKAHVAQKRDQPVLEGVNPWEQFAWSGVPHPYVAIYGTVLRDEASGTFRMWYNSYRTTGYATSTDGIAWNRPALNPQDGSNVIDLFGFHSPSVIFDRREPDPGRRYKAIGSKEDFPPDVITRLKGRFKSSDWYSRNQAYAAAYSGDGLHWTMYPEPALMGMDTITLAQDQVTGEYLAFHKSTQDPRSVGRQVLLSVSRDMQAWSEPDLAMATDEVDHQEARKLAGGTHAEFYNMSAFQQGGQWLGLVTLFRCVGAPLVGRKANAGQKGVIDVQLVHSRDGRKWERCSDRSPVIPVGPHLYDSGMVFGACNTPVLVGDEMWIYYSASVNTHAGDNPDKRISIGRAAWRRDGFVSLSATTDAGTIETALLRTSGTRLWVNADVSQGQLAVEVLDASGRPIRGYEASHCDPVHGAGIRQAVRWSRKETLPQDRPIQLRFHLRHGDLYSYTFE